MSVNSSGYRIRRYFPVFGSDVIGTDNARWAKDQPAKKAIFGKIGIQSVSDVCKAYLKSHGHLFLAF